MENATTPLAVVDEFAPVAILIVVAVGLAALILVVAHVIGPKRVGPIKHATYESGMDPIGDTRRRFNVRFYVIAVLFLVFDVELIFLYPFAVLMPRLHAREGEPHFAWAREMVAAGYTPAYLLGAIGVFFALLLVGLIYEWRRGVFKWN